MPMRYKTDRTLYSEGSFWPIGTTGELVLMTLRAADPPDRPPSGVYLGGVYLGLTMADLRRAVPRLRMLAASTLAEAIERLVVRKLVEATRPGQRGVKTYKLTDAGKSLLTEVGK